MTGEDKIAMSQTDLKRLHVIRKSIDKLITQIDAAQFLELGVRQVQRLAVRIKLEGDKGILHKSLGKPSNNRTDEKVKAKVISLYKTHYPDFGPTLGSEKLWERDKIRVNNETLRRWLIGAKIPYDSRKPRAHRQWRPRKPCFGEMLQMDGSHHDWLEGRGPWLVLMAYKDDATSDVFARFYEYEGSLPALDSCKRYVEKYGIPQGVYLDKHSAYRCWRPPQIEEQLKGQTEVLTQFGRALEELSIDRIYAHSPQAKGRIERQFRTFQHRLIKELRLANVKTLEEANKVLSVYLPKFNARFRVLPLKSVNLHRPLPKDLDLRRIFCIKEDKVLRNDWTVLHNSKLYQILEPIKAETVQVQEWTDGSLHIVHKKQDVKFKQIEELPKKQELQQKPKVCVRPTPPAAYHPWRHLPINVKKTVLKAQEALCA